MSIDVSIEWNATGRTIAYCYEGQRTLGVFGTRDEASLATITHLDSCECCLMYGISFRAELDVDESVNMSNRNAHLVFKAMGLEAFDEDGNGCGSIDADTLLAAAQVALVSNQEENVVPPSVAGGPGTGRATFIDFGVDADYLRGRLAQIADLATEAKRLNRNILWG